MTFQEIKEKLQAPIIWGNLLAMFLFVTAVFVGLWFWMDHYTQHGVEITVPNVEGCMVGDARVTMDRIGLVAEVTDSSYDRSLPPGTVLKQRPSSGALVKSGRMISLTVNSSEAPTLELPNLANNSSLREAQEMLRQFGFRQGPVEYVDGEKDWVIGVRCQGRQVYAGDKIPRDAAVTLQVGNGSTDEVEVGGDEEEGTEGDEEEDNSVLDKIIDKMIGM